MKFKSILCAMAALTVAAAATSCQNEEEVIPAAPNSGLIFEDGESLDFTINMPSEMRTRANQDPTLSYDANGLFNFSRDIDRLWYAVYNNGTLLYNSFLDGMPQASYDPTSRAFRLQIQLPKINGSIDLKQYSVFFFAGNALDNVQNKEVSNGIGLDFANKTLFAYPAFTTKTVAAGEMFNPMQYDYFAKYVTLDKVVDSSYNGHVTLIRPFCQVSLLTDELNAPVVLAALSSDSKVAVTTTPSVTSQVGSDNSETLPYGWNYGTDELLTKPIAQVPLTLNARAFNNVSGSLSIPQEVTFKTRKMFCAGSYLMLAPSARKSYKAGGANEKFKFGLALTGNRQNTSATVDAAIPSGGLKANEKYVLYNHQVSEGEGGEGGMFSTKYAIDIVVDPSWEGNKDLSY